MPVSDMLPMFGAFLAAVLAAGGIIALVAFVLQRGGTAAAPAPLRDDAVFLFQDGLLADATPAARRMITAIRSETPDLRVVAGHLSRRFPGLRERLLATGQQGDGLSPDTITGRDGSELLHIEPGHGHLRLVIDHVATTAATVDQSRIAALEEEVDVLRSIAEDAPQPIWQQEADGTLIWANRAYLALADRLSPPGPRDDPLWPAHPVMPTIYPLAETGATTVTRVQVAVPGLVEPLTYEVTSVRRTQATVHFAVDASNIVAAEQGRQRFIQTLTRTFAHLSAGLAIFDRERRLVLFNPAFLDLTTLPAIFLSQRPSVGEVLVRLRDLQMLPEPKNYIGWRDRVAALEAAAAHTCRRH